MNTVDLPALDGRDPLGFLATLGLLRVLGEQVRLSFSDTTGCAQIHGDFHDTDEIAGALRDIVEATDDDAALPALGPKFPLRPAPPSRAHGADKADESDPMRVLRPAYGEHLYARVEPLGSAAVEWLSFLVTDLAVDRAGRAALTPYMAPAGKQTVWTFFRKSLEVVRAEPSRLAEALTGWRRVDGFTGEYLDHRVLRSAADHPSGKSIPAGVPGATWLATQALPLLRVTGDGQNASATLWHRHNRRAVMIWPLWRPALDAHAVQTLLDHPLLRPTPSRQGRPVTVERKRLLPLGVFDVYGAERQSIEGGKSAGVLVPIRIADQPD
ncbi:type I-G CRISPR-associated protein, Cas3-extension family [Streptosporangium minutum]|uniref:Type I-U CRISPR-associated protein Cas8c n=1 Tax=Streptosporangium minutum TaxID=569862 RepID=A0A243RQV1_9ACTN|nr:hypothetical protein [Streptosporangium minutum]OUC97364.1 hypothetical protein CA984_11445 [Streptosporangium minutum]